MRHHRKTQTKRKDVIYSNEKCRCDAVRLHKSRNGLICFRCCAVPFRCELLLHLDWVFKWNMWHIVILTTLARSEFVDNRFQSAARPSNPRRRKTINNCRSLLATHLINSTFSLGRFDARRLCAARASVCCGCCCWCWWHIVARKLNVI